MTIRTEVELKTEDFAPGGFRNVTSQELRDFVDSRFGVGGIMSCKDETQNVTTSYAVFSAFTTSSDTKGVTEDLDNGHYTVLVGADGPYDLVYHANILPSVTGTVTIHLVKNGGLLGDYIDEQPVTSGVLTKFVLLGGTSAVAGDTLGVAIKGSGAAELGVPVAQFKAVRA